MIWKDLLHKEYKDIVETVEDIVKRFNIQNEEAKTGKTYSIKIKSEKQSFESVSSNNQRKEVTKKVKTLNS